MEQSDLLMAILPRKVKATVIVFNWIRKRFVSQEGSKKSNFLYLSEVDDKSLKNTLIRKILVWFEPP